jgi:hypothetical protein
MKMRLVVPLIMLFLLPATARSQESMMYVKNDKNPGVAFALNMFAPGAGLMYNDQVELGVGVFLGTVALLGSGAYMMSIHGTRADGGVYQTRGAGSALLITGGVVHLASTIYSPFKARQINRSHGKTAMRTGRLMSELAFGSTSSGQGFAFRF